MGTGVGAVDNHGAFWTGGDLLLRKLVSCFKSGGHTAFEGYPCAAIWVTTKGSKNQALRIELDETLVVTQMGWE